MSKVESSKLAIWLSLAVLRADAESRERRGEVCSGVSSRKSRSAAESDEDRAHRDGVE